MKRAAFRDLHEIMILKPIHNPLGKMRFFPESLKPSPCLRKLALRPGGSAINVVYQRD